LAEVVVRLLTPQPEHLADQAAGLNLAALLERERLAKETLEDREINPEMVAVVVALEQQATLPRLVVASA
jgi:hypothetical protein